MGEVRVHASVGQVVLAAFVLGSLAATSGGATGGPTPAVGWSDPTPEEGVPLQFFAVVPAGLLVAWDLGDGTRTDTVAPVHAYTDAGTYAVTLTVGDVAVRRTIAVADNGCGATWTVAHAGHAPFAVRAAAVDPSGVAGFAVGDGVLAFDGATWAVAAAPALAWTDVAVASSGSAVAVAADGRAAAWDGARWTVLPTPSAHLAAVALAEPGVGFAAGDGLYRIASNVFSPVPLDGLAAPLADVVAYSPTTSAFAFDAEDPGDDVRAYAVGEDGRFWSYDGRAWARRPDAPGPVRALAVSPEAVLAAGNGAVHRFDGAWTTEAVPDDLDALAVGPDGVPVAAGARVWRRDAAGWTELPLPAGAAPPTALAAGPDATWGLGSESVLRLAGPVVQPLAVTGAALPRVAAVDGGALVADATGGVRAWNGVGLGAATAPSGRPVVALAPVPGGALAADADGALLWLHEGAWTRVGTAPRAVRALAAAADGVPAYAVGDGGLLLVWDGSAWSPRASGTTRDLLGVAVAADGASGFAVGAAGTALRLDAAGWRVVPTGTTSTLRDVWTDGATALAVGDSRALRWTGTAWTVASIPTGAWRAVDADGGTAWAVGDGGRLARWTGSAWTALAAPTTRDLVDVAFTAPGRGLAVGAEGTVLRFLDRPCFAAAFDAPASAAEGAAVAFQDRSTPAPLDRVVAWSWTFGDGTWASGPAPVKTYANQGTFTVRLTVRDDDGASRTATRTVRIDDAVPRPVAAVPAEATEGAAVVLDATASSPGSSADPLRRFDWDLDHDGATFTVDATGATPTVRFADDGPRRVALRVTDEDSFALAVVDVLVADVAPFAIAPDDTAVEEGAPLALAGAAVADPYDPVAAWRWDLDGDGAFDDAEGRDVVATWDDHGDRVVRLLVEDEDGSTSVDATLVRVVDGAPLASVAGPRALAEGATGSWDGSASTPRGDPIVLWAWDLDGDGAFDDATGPVASAAFPSQGARTIALRTTDDDGSVDVAAFAVDVTDTGPSGVVVAPAEVAEGVPFDVALDAVAHDGVAAVAWEAPGGSVLDATATGARVLFDDAGDRVVRARVLDGDGSEAFFERAVVVREAVPSAAPEVPASVVEGDPVVIHGEASAGNDPVVLFEWDLHFDGTFAPEAVGAAPTVTFGDDGPTTVALRVSDDDGDTALATVQVQVVDRAPQVDLPPDASACVCEVLHVAATIGDDPADPVVEVAWDLDFDGRSFAPDVVGASVDLPVRARVTLAVRVTDEDGSVAFDVMVVTPACHPTVTAPPPATTTAGVPVDLAFEATNPAPAERTLVATPDAPDGWTVAVDPPGATVPPGASATFVVTATPPAGTPPGTVGEVGLAVAPDDCDLGARAVTTVTVGQVPPFLDADPESQTVTAAGGATARFTFTVRNLGEATLHGLEGAVVASPGWTATLSLGATELDGGASTPATLDVGLPNAVAEGDHAFTVRFSSADGGSDDVAAIVRVGNLAPVANAGPDRSFESGVVATLDGTRTVDGNGDTLVWTWVQLGGPPVALEGADGPTPTFRTPVVDAYTGLVFRLTVEDPSGAASSDEVRHTVRPRGRVDLAAPTLGDTSPGATVAYDVVVKNDLRVVDSVVLGLGPVPPDWTASLSSTRVGPLLPGASARVTLVVTAPPATAATAASAAVTVTGTSVYWSDPAWAPAKVPSDKVTVLTRLPLVLDVVAADVGTFDVATVEFRARFLDGAPAPGAAVAGAVTWAPALDLVEVHAFEGTADADGRLVVEVPLFLADALDRPLANLPGAHRVAAEAGYLVFRGPGSATYDVAPT